MNKSILSAALVMSSFLVSCGGSSDKVVIKDGDMSVSDAVKVGEKAAEGMKESQDRWAERKAKGDTAAMAYKDLQAYLPDVSGFSKDGNPNGEQMAVPGMGSWSHTEQKYKNGDKSLSVEIMDYNATQMAFTGATAMFKMNIQSENDDEKQGSVDLGVKDVAAFGTVHKKSQEAELAVVVADRFLINLKSEGNNDLEFLKGVAKNMKLGELAAK